MKSKSLITKSCPSLESCKYAVADSSIIEHKLNNRFDSTTFPAKVKVAISGCSMCCTMPKVRDIGFLATKKGWSLYFGGNGGNKPRIANLVAEKLSVDEAVELASRCLKIYSQKATSKMRTSTFIERYSLQYLLDRI